MAKSNRQCFLCGKKYHYCPTCSPDINKPSWYAMWCSETCKNLDNILAAHTVGKITIEEAKKQVETLSLNDMEFADEAVKVHYEQIIQYKEIKDNKEEDKIEGRDKVKVSDVKPKILPKSQINKK